jgi:hypothetical protein
LSDSSMCMMSPVCAYLTRQKITPSGATGEVLSRS